MIPAIQVRLINTLRASLPAVGGLAAYATDPDHSQWADATTTWRQKGSEVVRVDWVTVPSAGDITTANGIIDAFDASQAAQDAADLAVLKTTAKTVYDDVNATLDSQALAMRGLALVTMDELNILRQWITAFKVQTALATNLANFQTRVAALPNLPDRTESQIKPAIRNRIDTGA